MKGSTLHRSSLTREKMGVLAGINKNPDKRQSAKTQINQYYRSTKSKELDILWGSAQKGIQKMHNAAKSVQQKSPAAYLIIGFIAGALFMSLITFIVSLSSMNPRVSENIATESTATNNNVAIIGEDENTAPVNTYSEEKYVVKAGDTLNGIAYRFYGKYDEEKILEIQRINNITNPAAIRIGQELMIPVSQER